jgi:hypothetical protein
LPQIGYKTIKKQIKDSRKQATRSEIGAVHEQSKSNVNCYLQNRDTGKEYKSVLEEVGGHPGISMGASLGGIV